MVLDKNILIPFDVLKEFVPEVDFNREDGGGKYLKGDRGRLLWIMLRDV